MLLLISKEAPQGLLRPLKLVTYLTILLPALIASRFPL